MIVKRACHGSEAEAEPPLIMTMTGLSLMRSPPLAHSNAGFPWGTAARRARLAPLQERIGDRDRLIEQSAWVVAEVDDEALELSPAWADISVIAFFRPSVVCSLKWVIRIKPSIAAIEARAHRAHLNERG